MSTERTLFLAKSKSNYPIDLSKVKWFVSEIMAEIREISDYIIEAGQAHDISFQTGKLDGFIAMTETNMANKNVVAFTVQSADSGDTQTVFCVQRDDGVIELEVCGTEESMKYLMFLWMTLDDDLIEINPGWLPVQRENQSSLEPSLEESMELTSDERELLKDLGLTKTEIIVAMYVIDGFDRQSIKDKMVISVRGVDNHLNSLYDKFAIVSKGNRKLEPLRNKLKDYEKIIVKAGVEILNIRKNGKKKI